MSILLSDPFKSAIENFKQDLVEAVSRCVKDTSCVTASELFNGFHSDSDPSSLAIEEVSSARFVFEVKDPLPCYCFEIVFDVITENPQALMQNKLNNANIVFRMDVKQKEEDCYILVNSIEVGLLSDLGKTRPWVENGLVSVYSFLDFQEKLRKNDQANQYVKAIKDKFFYVKDVAIKEESSFLLNRGCISVTLTMDSERLNCDEEIAMTLNCKLGLVKSKAKHIKDLPEDSSPEWFFSSSLKRKKAAPTSKLKYPLLRTEQLSHEKLTILPSSFEYIKLLDNAVSHVYHYFNAP